MSTQPNIDFDVEQYKEQPHGIWNVIPVTALKTSTERKVAHRLNALGSLFYHSKVVLRNTRLSENFHYDICQSIEREHLKEVLEVPRDHFKSTICSESAPIWWALPFSDQDEMFMRALGYGDAWCRWMKRAHNQDTRTLLVSENITNARKLGVRIDGHYTDNKFFRTLFPEIIPGSTSSWTQDSKTHKRSSSSKPHGEGTFDYLGVGAALQSRHYDRVIQDDLVGKAAAESDVVMQKTIEYHKLLVGAFDSVPGQELDNDEIVVGNRWSWRDLNSYIRENETYFRITNHSALGGCCDKHPEGLPIFPEEFTVQKLERFSRRLGTYLFSCQFLNNPTTPEALEFDQKNLRFYNWRKEYDGDGRGQVYIQHEVADQEVLEDIPVNKLQIVMVADPNHSGADGRCNHAITVVGIRKNVTRTYINKEDGTVKTALLDNIYLLDCWADHTSYDKFIHQIYALAEKWKLRGFYLETIAAQGYLKYHLEFRNRVESRKLKIWELNTPKTKNAKEVRIEALGPYLENKQIFCRRSQAGFIRELSLYPNGNTRDILDTLGYAAQIWGKGMSPAEYNEFYSNNQPAVGAGPCGY